MKDIDFEGLSCYTVKLKVSRAAISEELKYLCLESDSNPDYYAKHHFPPNKQSNVMDISIPVKKDVSCFQDIVIRTAVKIRENYGQHFGIFPGQMIYENKNRACVHLRVHNFDMVADLLQELKKKKISFYSDKKIEDYETIVFYKKHTRFVKLQEGVYQDKDDENKYFFQIDKHIEFDKFSEGMEQIKLNCDFHLFDSFLIHHFTNDTVKDFIGIHSKHCDKNRFNELLENIKHVFSS